MKIFILTEGGKDIGFGHITRCTSLYQAFEEKGIIPEFIVNGDDSILDLLSDKKYRIFNWIEHKEYLFDYIKNADIVIIDSYLADISFYENLSKIVKIPVYIDDNERIDYPKGVVVNGAIYAEELDYPQKDGITYLLGTKYTPLRKEFWDVAEKELKKEVESVMITFGGDDMRNMTPKVLKLLVEEFPDLKKNVVIGKGFKNINEIEKLKDDKTNLIDYPSAEEMKNVMLESDIAISACGQTLNELASVGVPTIGICIAENQLGNIKGWEKIGFLEYAGWYSKGNILEKIKNAIERLKDTKERKNKFKIAKKIIDGKGSLKIVDRIMKELL